MLQEMRRKFLTSYETESEISFEQFFSRAATFLQGDVAELMHSCPRLCSGETLEIVLKEVITSVFTDILRLTCTLFLVS